MKMVSALRMSVIIGVSMGLCVFFFIIVGIVFIKPLNPKEDGVIADGEGSTSVEADTKSPKSNGSSKNNSISAHGLAGHLAGVTAGESVRLVLFQHHLNISEDCKQSELREVMGQDQLCFIHFRNGNGDGEADFLDDECSDGDARGGEKEAEAARSERRKRRDGGQRAAHQAEHAPPPPGEAQQLDRVQQVSATTATTTTTPQPGMDESL